MKWYFPRPIWLIGICVTFRTTVGPPRAMPLKSATAWFASPQSAQILVSYQGRPRSRRHQVAAASHILSSRESVIFMWLSHSRQSYSCRLNSFAADFLAPSAGKNIYVREIKLQPLTFVNRVIPVANGTEGVLSTLVANGTGTVSTTVANGSERVKSVIFVVAAATSENCTTKIKTKLASLIVKLQNKTCCWFHSFTLFTGTTVQHCGMHCYLVSMANGTYVMSTMSSIYTVFH